MRNNNCLRSMHNYKLKKDIWKHNILHDILSNFIGSNIIILNYSRNSIWTDNCTMNPKIDPCCHNTTQFTCQKGIKSPRQSSEQLLSCQGSLIVAIPAAHSAYRYLRVFHRIHSYKGSCYTAWMWYILLNELLLQQSSAVLNGRYQCVVFARLLITPIV